MKNDINTNKTNVNSDSDDSRTSSSDAFADFDINTILKLKGLMEGMNSNKDDPRSNLLLSLKPYLKEDRKDKVDQYIKIFGMTKIINVINPLGGDLKK